MLTRFFVFFLLLLTILGGGTAWLAWRLVGTLTLPEPWSAVGTASIFGLTALIVVGTFGARMAPKSRASDALAGGAFLGMALFSNLFVLVVLRDLAWLAFNLVGGLPSSAGTFTAGADTPPTIALVNGAIVTLAIGLVAVGWMNARGTPRIKDVDVPIEGLPEALDGFTIVQLTDVHVGPTYGREQLAAVVDRTNAADADIVAITGDLVDGGADELRAHVAPLAQLRARHGTFFVTGNHEYYSGALPWVRELRTLGMRVLLNEHELLEHDGARIVVAGVTDYNAGSLLPEHESDPARALAGAPKDAVRVMLAHQPRSILAAEAVGVDLQLSGHTHGGQFWPWMHMVRLQQPYVAGLRRHGRSWIYTSRGTGYWGPPVRLGAPAEIARIRLRRR